MREYQTKYYKFYPEIDKMLEKGLKDTEIAETLGITVGVVIHRRKKLGISRVKPSTYDLYGKEIFEMWNNGLNRGEISKKLGISREKIRSALRLNGYEMHDNHDTKVWLEKLKTELLSYGFEYVSGYERYNSRIKIKDLSNGIIFEVNAHNFIERKRSNKICDHYEPDRDKNITLKKIYKKYNGICYICGKKCDYSDWWVNERGTKCFGGDYPSLEHIIPRAKGGKTQKSNILLAHRRCNSQKNTKSMKEADIIPNI